MVKEESMTIREILQRNATVEEQIVIGATVIVFAGAAVCELIYKLLIGGR